MMQYTLSKFNYLVKIIHYIYNQQNMKKIALWMLTAMLLTACGSKKNQMPEANNDFAVITVQTTEADLNTSYPASIKYAGY